MGNSEYIEQSISQSALRRVMNDVLAIKLVGAFLCYTVLSAYTSSRQNFAYRAASLHSYSTLSILANRLAIPTTRE